MGMLSLKHCLLYLSLVLNGLFIVAMGAAISWRLVDPVDPPEREVALDIPDSADGGNLHTSSLGGKEPGDDRNEERAFYWERLRADDPREYIANLKAAGAPDETIAMMVIAQVQRKTSELMNRRHGESVGVYWKPSDYTLDPETQVNLLTLQRDADALLRDTFGEEFVETLGNGGLWWREQVNREPREERIYGFLPAEKRQDIMALKLHFQRVRGLTGLGGEGYLFPGEFEEKIDEQQRLREELNAEIEVLLTPEELWEYDMRNSVSAAKVGEDFRYMDISEEEFREIYAIRHSYEDDFVSLTSGVNPVRLRRDEEKYTEYQRQLAEVRRRFEEELKEMLGNERFREYELSNLPPSRTLIPLTERLGLPRERAFEMIELHENTRKRSHEIQLDSALSADEKSAALHLLSEQVAEQALESLGERGFEVYREDGGIWMNSLERWWGSPRAAD